MNPTANQCIADKLRCEVDRTANSLEGRSAAAASAAFVDLAIDAARLVEAATKAIEAAHGAILEWRARQ